MSNKYIPNYGEYVTIDVQLAGAIFFVEAASTDHAVLRMAYGPSRDLTPYRPMLCRHAKTTYTPVAECILRSVGLYPGSTALPCQCKCECRRCGKGGAA